MTTAIYTGDCRDVLETLPANSVQCVVTSPPYYGLRDYGTAHWEGGEPDCDHRGPGRAAGKSTLKNDGRPQERTGQNDYDRGISIPYRRKCEKCGALRIDNQIGLEQTPDEYIAQMVDVFREVRRVLRGDGVVWLNLGDSYATGGQRSNNNGLKPKDLIGIPWRVALALQADGWWLRQDIIWHKPNPMPESVTDRCTKAHEYIFLLTKSARYFYDAEAIKETASLATVERNKYKRKRKQNGGGSFESMKGGNVGDYDFGDMSDTVSDVSRNKRSVWTITTQGFSEAHFATFPPDLVEPCIKAGTSERGCCAECGAPWKRVVERTSMEVKPASSRDARSQDGQLRTQTNGTMTKPPTSRTIDWQPSCSCDSEIVPCICVDMFCGAGTVGLVADRLGRDAILIDLNPEYAEMARRRIVADAPMFAKVVMIEEV